MGKSGLKSTQDNTIKTAKNVSQVSLDSNITFLEPLLSYEIPIRLHVFQNFNNCGPATLSMVLSYWGIDKNQVELGQILRPYQVANGDNDDKSVNLKEVANQAEVYGLYSYLRPNGDIEKIKMFISNGIPVVARTWTKIDEDIGHYRIIRGYDDKSSQIIQDDSLQGKNIRYSYFDFLNLWKTFNYEYLVIVNDSKKEIAEKILAEDLDEKTAWKNAKARVENELKNNSDDIHLIFALSRINYYLEDYHKSVSLFEQVENNLSFRTLWYQIEPIQSYYELKDYNRVFELTEKILNNHNRAFSELYIIRGNIFKNQGNLTAAKSEYEKAVYYNSNLESAKKALNSI